jgi:hypothetical protein
MPRSVVWAIVEAIWEGAKGKSIPNVFAMKRVAVDVRFVSFLLFRIERLPSEIANALPHVGNLCLHFRAHLSTSKEDGLKTRSPKY